ncbi:MAG: HlyD family efflux transporter periplasmic adaptor subunit, partial [Planctomycetaceae bacterium]
RMSIVQQLLLRALVSTSGRRWVLGVGLLAVALAGLAVTPVAYRVEARGRLQPATGRALFAPRDAEVTEVFVTGGERVVAGQPLVQLRDQQLDSELLAARNRVLEKRQQADAQQAEIDELSRRGNRPDELLRLRGRLVQSQAERRAAEERWEHLEAEAGRLTVRAPLAGTVASFEPGRELSHRPVRRGDTLMEVLDDAGPWRLELRVPESQVGVLQQARVHRAGGQETAGQLPVDYVLATNPEARHAAVLDRVATRTSVAPERGTVLEVTAQIAAPPAAPMGTEVVAKIDCGPHPLLFVVFGDLYHLALRTLW